MITKSDTTASGVTTFYIVQHIPDVFRRESRNVGVIVARGREITAKFFGEKPGGLIDGRSIRDFDYPDVYRQWVHFWRKAIKKNKDTEDAIKRIVDANADHYAVIEGGAIDGTKGDSIESVCNYAYSMLVSEGGLVEALGHNKDQLAALENLRDEIKSEFKELEIMSGTEAMLAKHPIMADQHVLGASASHQFSFIQRDSKWWLIEPVNFITRQKLGARDHAGWATLAFADVLHKHKENAVPIAVIRLAEHEKDNEVIEYSLSMLRRVARIVDWMNPAEKYEFLEERRAVALA